MEFKTAKHYYTTFRLVLAGILIGISIAALSGKVVWPAILIFVAIILIPNIFFNIILSINIVDDQLVLKTIRLFRERTTFINITEIELQLFYTPRKPKRKAFYSMHVVRNSKVLHEIEYDRNKLSAFILDFNKKKSQILNLKTKENVN